MNSRWLQHGLELLAAKDISAVLAMLAVDGVDAADREQLAGAYWIECGDANKAAIHFSAVLALRPQSAAAHSALGSALQAQGRYQAAAASFQRAVDLVPDDVDALVGQGECSLELGQYEDARDCFEIALAHAPTSVRAMCGIGKLLRLSGDIPGSIQIFEDALKIAGPNADVFFGLGLTLNRKEDINGTVTAYEQAISLDPKHLGALVNLGLVYLSQLGDAQRAQKYFEAARTTHPHSTAAQANFGLALQEQGRFDLAITHYDALLKQAPDVIEYRWNRALAHLYQGNYEQGWLDYELRHVRGGRDVRRDFGLPDWDGSNPEQHHLLIYGEQGVGDEIMFASCLPDLVRRAAGIVLECDARLVSLFTRSFPGIQVHGAARDESRDWMRRYPALDRQFAIGSQPRFLRRRTEDFPGHPGYLVPDALRVSGWRQHLDSGSHQLTIGLSWRGGTRKTRTGLRSLELLDFLPLADAQRRRFICLQRGDCADEIAAAHAAGLDLQCWPEALDDLEETTALIAALDLVISVDNTVVHLAGALGKPCWTLLANVPDWRYGLHVENMPWYPALRLFRQPTSRDWRGVVTAVARELAALPSK